MCHVDTCGTTWDSVKSCLFSGVLIFFSYIAFADVKICEDMWRYVVRIKWRRLEVRFKGLLPSTRPRENIHGNHAWKQNIKATNYNKETTVIDKCYFFVCSLCSGHLGGRRQICPLFERGHEKSTCVHQMPATCFAKLSRKVTEIGFQRIKKPNWSKFPNAFPKVNLPESAGAFVGNFFAQLPRSQHRG